MEYKTHDELKKLIDGYFTLCQKSDEPATITGLALFLKVPKEKILNCPDNDNLSDMFKYARLKIENAYEQRLIKRGNSGDIFALRVLGWNDKHENDLQEGFTYTSMETIKVDNKELDFTIGDDTNVGITDNS